jgi:hypothetical protein
MLLRNWSGLLRLLSVLTLLRRPALLSLLWMLLRSWLRLLSALSLLRGPALLRLLGMLLWCWTGLLGLLSVLSLLCRPGFLFVLLLLGVDRIDDSEKHKQDCYADDSNSLHGCYPPYN